MSLIHDELTVKASAAIIGKIRVQDNDWKQIFSNSISRMGDFGWPRPDYVCFDNELQQSFAFEFKPPKQTKREYLTGLGQSIAYLQKHHYAALIVPRKAESFLISEYIKTVLELDHLKGLPLALIDYDEDIIGSEPNRSIRLLKPISEKREVVLQKASLNETYWCWWRDGSHYEVLQLLQLSDKYNDQVGDIYSEYIWPEFWKLMVEGKTKQWDGSPRTISGDSDTPNTSYKQNYKIPLFQLGLWEQGEGRLTIEGYKAMSFGKLFGPDSSQFKDYLTQLILLNGKHLQLIQDVIEFQKTASPEEKSSSANFKKGIENFLESKGSIGARKPGRTTTDAKGSYLRDEPKLWNKFDLLERDNNGNYFFEGEGYKFDWVRITEIITKDFSI